MFLPQKKWASRPCSRIILWCENESHVNHDHEDDDVTEDDVNDEEDVTFQSAKEGFGLVMAPLFFLKMTFVVFVDIIMTSAEGAASAAFLVTAAASTAAAATLEASTEKDAFSASKSSFP